MQCPLLALHKFSGSFVPHCLTLCQFNHFWEMILLREMNQYVQVIYCSLPCVQLFTNTVMIVYQHVCSCLFPELCVPLSAMSTCLCLCQYYIVSLNIICYHGNHHLPAPAKMYSIYGHTRGPLPVGEVDHMLLRSSYVIVHPVVWIFVPFAISTYVPMITITSLLQPRSIPYMELSGTQRRKCLSGPPRRELTTTSMPSSSHRQQPTSLSVKVSVLLCCTHSLMCLSVHSILQYCVLVKDV